MLKTHFNFLKRAVSIAINYKSSVIILDTLQHGGSKSSIYGVILDIVADARFYKVTENDSFWRLYATYTISRFLDSICADEWGNIEKVTSRKEDFLNEWFINHILPLSENEKEEKKRVVLREMKNEKAKTGVGVEGAEGTEEIEHDIFDNTGNSAQGNGFIPFAAKQYLGAVSPEKVAGRGAADGYSAEADYLKCIDPELVRLANMIGRSGNETQPGGLYRHATRSDIDGITTGDDLNSVLPVELAMLSTPATEDLFLHRFTRKRLQIFSSASKCEGSKTSAKGPIYMCIDTSGSMSGEPEMMAKTLALAIAIVAQRDRRPLVIVNYSHQVSFFVLTNLAQQRSNLMAFLSYSYRGGNDEDLLMKFLFKVLPECPKYRNFRNQFEGADLLVISDFIWEPLKRESRDYLEEARARGMKVYALSVDSDDDYDSEPESERAPLNGVRFYQKSDFRFRYKDNQLIQN